MSRQPVFVQRAAPGRPQEAEAAVEAMFAALPAAARLGPESRVLLKPNLLSRHAPAHAATTHPDVVRAVILALQRRGVRHITLADSPGGPYSPAVMRGLYAATGMAAVCGEAGAALYTACESEARPVTLEGRAVHEFLLLRPVLESDFIINLAKMKTHVLTGMTGAVKNLFGCVPGLHKAEMHMLLPEKERFGRMLVDLCETVRADIHLVDAGLAMEGDGPGGGTPRPVGLLFAGEDPYELDLALCRYMGIDPMQTPVLAAAHAAGLCAAAADDALLAGDAEAARPPGNFVQPRSYNVPMNFVERLPRLFGPLKPALTRWAAPRPVVEKPLCTGCGKCDEICPQDVVTLKNGKAFIHKKNCIRCFCCHEMCPAKAIDVHRNRLFAFFSG